jgi:tetratricopeptide (TPR) repeat protein
MTKTLVFVLSFVALASAASAQSYPYPVPAPFIAPAPVGAPPMVAAPVYAQPWQQPHTPQAAQLPQPSQPPQQPQAAQLPQPPQPPEQPQTPQAAQLPQPPQAPEPFVVAPLELPDFNFDFSGLADLDVQVDKALKASEKALEKLPTLSAMQLPPRPAAPARGPLKFASDEQAYDQARNFIERDQYDRALDALDRVIDGKGTRVDAAMYWKAYSLAKLSRRPEALTVLADLQKQFPNGPWVKDARALEVELKQTPAQSVADLNDDDIKVLALNGLMQSQSEQALPQIEKLLQGDSSVRVKQRALIVLSQSSNPRARTLLVNVAKSGSNPDLRLWAIRYLGMRNDSENGQALEEIYRSTGDREIKQAILRSFITSPNSMDRLAQIARTEKDEELQKTAIRTLGASGRADSADALGAIYRGDSSVDVKKEVINALAMNSRNAAALVSIAKAEKNAELKKAIVTRLSVMRTPEAQQYMVDILNDGK